MKRKIKRNPTSNQNLTRVAPVSVTTLVFVFLLPIPLAANDAAADTGSSRVEKIWLEAVNWACQQQRGDVQTTRFFREQNSAALK